MCGYGLDLSITSSRSKNLAPGIRAFWNSSLGFLGTFGINQVQSKITGEVPEAIADLSSDADTSGFEPEVA